MDALAKKKLKAEWADTLTLLEDLSDDKRMHFALLLSKLAKCYVEDGGHKAVLLVDNNDHLMTISVGATEMECMEILNKAQEVMGMVVTEDAPAREMFN
jgi:hypothetical protein